MMKRYFTVYLLFLSFTILPSLAADEELDANDYKSIHWCYYNGKKYAFGVSDVLYDRMTAWKIGDKKPPPVSPQQAHKLAKERLVKIEIKNGYRWELKQVGVKPIGGDDGKWVWKVSFQLAVIEGGMTGRWPTMDFLVTMDGELIEPVISDQKRNN